MYLNVKVQRLRFRNIGFLERLDTLIRCLIVAKMLHFARFLIRLPTPLFHKSFALGGIVNSHA
jgi:hypothetical protein